MSQSRVVHLQRAGTDLAYCGETGPLFIKTFDVESVTCAKCRRRGRARVAAPKPVAPIPGRVLQPGGGQRRR